METLNIMVRRDPTEQNTIRTVSLWLWFSTALAELKHVWGNWTFVTETNEMIIYGYSNKDTQNGLQVKFC